MASPSHLSRSDLHPTAVAPLYSWGSASSSFFLTEVNWAMTSSAPWGRGAARTSVPRFLTESWDVSPKNR